MRFFYVLPYCQRALVEFTVFSQHSTRRAYQDALWEHFATVLRITDHRLTPRKVVPCPSRTIRSSGPWVAV